MNGLFAGFDLAVTPSKTAVTETKVKAGKVTTKPAVNLGLFAGTELEEFNIELNKPKVEALLGKLNNTDEREVDAAKILKSKKVSLEEKLEIIRTKVLEVLGKQRKNVVVIRDKASFEEYVSKAIQFGRIAIDTETNNSTDPMTCQLMGLCLYYEGGKQAYIPVNHVDPKTIGPHRNS